MQMNAYVTRCQHVLQQGRTVCSVGLYYDQFNYPDAVLTQEELVGGVLPRDDAPLPRRALEAKLKAKLDTEERWTQTQIQLGDHLTANGYSYLHLNPESVLRAEVQDGALVVGAARLRVLVLSQVERIPPEVARRLQEIVEAGVPVVFVGRVPDKQPGFYRHRENDALVAGITSTLAQETDCVVYTYKGVASYLSDRLGIRPALAFSAPQPTIQHIHKRIGEREVYLIRHGGPEPVDFSVRLAHPEGVPPIWTRGPGRLAWLHSSRGMERA